MPAVEVLRPSPGPLPLVSGPQSHLIDAVVRWSECLQGQLPLTTALRHLAEGLGARAVCLSRHPRRRGGPVRAVTYNAPSSVRLGQAVTRSFAHCVLGRYVDRPRPASVWSSAAAEEQEDPALAVFQKRARIAETVVIALALEDRWADYLEIHLARAAGAPELFGALAETLSRTWTRRSPGLFSDAILASQTPAGAPLREPILGLGNPAHLSRAEFRVCLLLSRGLNTRSVCAELSISPSTLKAHLRSIFAKTEVSSLVELLYRLLAPLEGEARPVPAMRWA